MKDDLPLTQSLHKLIAVVVFRCEQCFGSEEREPRVVSSYITSAMTMTKLGEKESTLYQLLTDHEKNGLSFLTRIRCGSAAYPRVEHDDNRDCSNTKS